MGEGFIPGSRGSLVLDLVAAAMVLILAFQSWSLVQVRWRQSYRTHKKWQLSIAGLLVLALAIFEIDIRIIGWTHLAAPSPYFASWVFPALYLHLGFAIATVVLWILVISLALKNFPHPPRPHNHSQLHRRLAVPAVAALYGTTLSGWLFYWLAFVAQ